MTSAESEAGQWWLATPGFAPREDLASNVVVYRRLGRPRAVRVHMSQNCSSMATHVVAFIWEALGGQFRELLVEVDRGVVAPERPQVLSESHRNFVPKCAPSA